MCYKLIISIFCIALLVSCNDSPPEKAATAKEQQVQETSQSVEKKVPAMPEVDQVVAVVNGSPITQLELDFAIRKVIGKEAAARMDDNATRKVLESMVMSRAISLEREKEMNEQEQQETSMELAAFKEQLLVRSYLAQHGSPKPVTMTMIQDYYDAHPELFGDKKIKQYEMITSKRPLNAGERDELLGKLAESGKREKWQTWTKELAAQGYPVAYRQGKVGTEVLHTQLTHAMQRLTSGQTSELIFIQDTPYLVRIVDEQTVPARPLSEVAGTIREALAPMQVKNAIQQVGKDVLEKATIEYK